MSDADNGDNEDKGGEGGSILDDGGIDTDERAGRSLGIEPDAEPDEDTKKEMEEERKERLDPDNRPDGAEVDNTDRTFDVERGMYTDSEEYDESEPPPFSDKEDPNNPDNADSDDSTGSSDPKDDAGDDAGDSEDEAEDKDHDSGDDKES